MFIDFLQPSNKYYSYYFDIKLEEKLDKIYIHSKIFNYWNLAMFNIYDNSSDGRPGTR